MTQWANEATGDMRAWLALLVANARFWPTVAPQVRRELCLWTARADAIPDPTLRGHALDKLRDEHFNAQVAATLATLASRPHRARVISAIVAFQLMYDYLDGLSEQPVGDPLRNGRRLFAAFSDALTPGAPPTDYYRHHPQNQDGGYLQQLVATCQLSLQELPGAATVEAEARRAAAACGEAQTRTHAIPNHGIAPLRSWAVARTPGTGLLWWELAGGAAASSLTVHALLAAAARPTTTVRDASRIASAYLPVCALSTLLDSLADRERDARDGSHQFIAYYPDRATRVERVSAVAQIAAQRSRGLRDSAHHVMTVAGVAGYYLTAPGARSRFARPATARVERELSPLIVPILLIFRAWRGVKRLRAESSWQSVAFHGTESHVQRDPDRDRLAA